MRGQPQGTVQRGLKGLLRHAAAAIGTIAGKRGALGAGAYRHTVFSADLNKSLSQRFALRVRDAFYLRKIPPNLLVKVDKADYTGLCIAGKHSCHLLKVCDMSRSGVGIGKKNGVKPEQWNLKISLGGAGKTVLLAAAAVGMGYAITLFAKYFFQVDFRLMSYVVKVPSSDDFLVALRFMPLFAIFFFANALCQNLSNMIAGRKEWLNILICCVANIVGLAVIWIIQYSVFIGTGVLKLNGTRVMLSWPLFINLCICTVVSRIFYKKTGKVYIGALINTIMFAIIACANTMTLVCNNWWF